MSGREDDDYKEYLANWFDAGLHPDVRALQNRLRDELDRKWPQPRTIDVLGPDRYNQLVSDWGTIRKEVEALAYSIFVRFEEAGYDRKAFASEQLLRAAIENKFDPWACTFDLAFRQNYRFPPSFSDESEFFACLNERQKKFIYTDRWWGRAMNGGAEPMFCDPRPDFIVAWWSLDVVEWPSFAEKVRRCIEVVMRVSADEVSSRIAKHGLIRAGGAIRAARFENQPPFLEDMSSKEQAEFDRLNSLLLSQQTEFEQKVLQAIWKWRDDLIQSPPTEDFAS
ncbi:MAG: hypothetical protein WAU68_15490 [Vitreimonas sp.]